MSEDRKQPQAPAPVGPDEGIALPVREGMGARGRGGATDIIEESPGEQAALTFSTKQMMRARDVLARLHGLRRSRQLYPPGHPAVEQAAADLLRVAELYHEEGVDVPLTFFEDQVLLGEQLLLEDSVLFDQLIRDMTAIGAGSVVIKRGVTLDEIVRLAEVISLDPAQAAVRGGVSDLIRREGVEHVEIKSVSLRAGVPEAGGGRSDARAAYTDALDLMREIDRILRSNRVIDAGHVRGVVRSLAESVLENRFAMLELASLKRFDEYTFYHSVNVAILSIALGSMVAREARFLSTLGTGALLHDVGKMMVPLEVLNKTAPLTTEEWALVRHHPVYGAENILMTPGLDKAASIIVFEHHMRFDLDGYPAVRGLEKQHVASRIVAIADAYDAMTSQRAYSSPRRRDEAMSIIAKNAGSALDPDLVRLFIVMLGPYPPGSVVRLSTQETAVVVAPAPHDLAAPRVRIVANGEGEVVDGPEVDLSDPAQAAGRTIEACLDVDETGYIGLRLPEGATS